MTHEPKREERPDPSEAAINALWKRGWQEMSMRDLVEGLQDAYAIDFHAEIKRLQQAMQEKDAKLEWYTKRTKWLNDELTRYEQAHAQAMQGLEAKNKALRTERLLKVAHWNDYWQLERGELIERADRLEAEVAQKTKQLDDLYAHANELSELCESYAQQLADQRAEQELRQQLANQGAEIEKVNQEKTCLDIDLMEKDKELKEARAEIEKVKEITELCGKQRDGFSQQVIEQRTIYDALAKRANQLEHLVGSIAELLRKDMTNE